MNKILATIHNIVGEAGLITGDDVRQRPQNWQGQGSCQALAIVRPASTEEVSAVLKACNDCGQTIVPFGGLTGLVHGTDAAASEIMLSLERMTTIENIDPVGKTVLVQAGSPLQAVQEAVAALDLQFALDLGARGSCTIGGNISTNAGGNQVLRYGMMREQVLGLEVVLADGTILNSLNSLLKNNAGYDIKQLFIGSEGTLGIVTRAVLRLHPQPRSRNTALIGVSCFEELTALFSFMSEQLAGGLTAFEVMWQDHYRLIAIDSGRHNAPLSADHSYYVIVEQQGRHPERDGELFSNAFELAVESRLFTDAVLAQSETQRQQIWNIREDIEGMYQALMPACIFDVSLMISEMENYTITLKQAVLSRWGEQAKIIIFGHLGDGNLHIIISVGDVKAETREEIERLVYTPLLSLKGSISAEHGIGLEKRDYLKFSRTEAEIALMARMKKMLDPKNILNRNKILL
mgnify:CR=1 FL=1